MTRCPALAQSLPWPGPGKGGQAQRSCPSFQLLAHRSLSTVASALLVIWKRAQLLWEKLGSQCDQSEVREEECGRRWDRKGTEAKSCRAWPATVRALDSILSEAIGWFSSSGNITWLQRERMTPIPVYKGESKARMGEGWDGGGLTQSGSSSQKWTDSGHSMKEYNRIC